MSNGHWIEDMHMQKGALHRALGIPVGKKIGAKKIQAAKSSSNPTISREAKLAQTLKGLKK